MIQEPEVDELTVSYFEHRILCADGEDRHVLFYPTSHWRSVKAHEEVEERKLDCGPHTFGQRSVTLLKGDWGTPVGSPYEMWQAAAWAASLTVACSKCGNKPNVRCSNLVERRKGVEKEVRVPHTERMEKAGFRTPVPTG